MTPFHDGMFKQLLARERGALERQLSEALFQAQGQPNPTVEQLAGKLETLNRYLAAAAE